MSTNPPIYKSKGIFAQPNMEPPVNALFSQLRDRWVKMEPGRSYSQLATLLGVPSQNISQWATGSDGRKPPWNVIFLLAEETGFMVVATSREWRLAPLDPKPV